MFFKFSFLLRNMQLSWFSLIFSWSTVIKRFDFCLSCGCRDWRVRLFDLCVGIWRSIERCFEHSDVRWRPNWLIIKFIFIWGLQHFESFLYGLLVHRPTGTSVLLETAFLSALSDRSKTVCSTTNLDVAIRYSDFWRVHILTDHRVGPSETWSASR